MSKVASITISAKSPARSSFDKSSPMSSGMERSKTIDQVAPGSDSDEERFTRRRRSSASASPERKMFVSYFSFQYRNTSRIFIIVLKTACVIIIMIHYFKTFLVCTWKITALSRVKCKQETFSEEKIEIF